MGVLAVKWWNGDVDKIRKDLGWGAGDDEFIDGALGLMVDLKVLSKCELEFCVSSGDVEVLY